jgi:hypothetical protein
LNSALPTPHNLNLYNFLGELSGQKDGSPTQQSEVILLLLLQSRQDKPFTNGVPGSSVIYPDEAKISFTWSYCPFEYDGVVCRTVNNFAWTITAKQMRELIGPLPAAQAQAGGQSAQVSAGEFVSNMVRNTFSAISSAIRGLFSPFAIILDYLR